MCWFAYACGVCQVQAAWMFVCALANNAAYPLHACTQSQSFPSALPSPSKTACPPVRVVRSDGVQCLLPGDDVHIWGPHPLGGVLHPVAEYVLELAGRVAGGVVLLYLLQVTQYSHQGVHGLTHGRRCLRGQRAACLPKQVVGAR